MASVKVLDYLEKMMNTYKELKKKLEMFSASTIKIKGMDGNTNSRTAILDKLLEIDDMLEGLDVKEESLIRLIYLEGITFDKASSMVGISRATAFRMRDRAATKIYERKGEICVPIRGCV
ncbi:MAG TPA: DUF134 domain-containing protein [Caldisericia bacterium]|jgi:DNA-directed RNA polymerase specialized sigma24 family protein|nr:MAG: hypothetical protein BWX90_00356 [bacterium ADurb.Bin132]HNW31541.1 DUF134 domain-containing protein [Caldisericia bacterium]HNY61979.1 DUF134 domain-containing protein [Caldisericia bacterium]HOG71102.1 DUF134 domain-containing protein [Caldisericia bacterium]HPM44418.1 DUF134 domain-containing protein [Caldisericia bacterium]